MKGRYYVAFVLDPSQFHVHSCREKQHFWENDICGSLNLVSLFQYFVSFFSRHFLYEAEQGVTAGLIVAKAKPYCHHGVQPHTNYWYHYSYSYYCFCLYCHFFTATTLIWNIISFGQEAVYLDMSYQYHYSYSSSYYLLQVVQRGMNYWCVSFPAIINHPYTW